MLAIGHIDSIPGRMLGASFHVFDELIGEIARVSERINMRLDKFLVMIVSITIISPSNVFGVPCIVMSKFTDVIHNALRNIVLH